MHRLPEPFIDKHSSAAVDTRSSVWTLKSYRVDVRGSHRGEATSAWVYGGQFACRLRSRVRRSPRGQVGRTEERLLPPISWMRSPALSIRSFIRLRCSKRWDGLPLLRVR